MSQVVRDLNQALPIPDSGIASTPLLDLKGGIKLVLFAMDQGQEISPHAAPFPAEIRPVEGKIDVLVGNNWTELNPSQTLALPQDVPHGVRAKEPCHFLLTMLRGSRAESAPALLCPATNPLGLSSPVLLHWMAQHEAAVTQLARMTSAADSGDWAVAGEVAAWLYGELKAHNEAEEVYLFPLMDPAFGGQHGPTDCMRDEHRHIWDSTQRLQASLQAEPGGGPEAARLAHVIAADLGAHIEKENQVLYPMAERILGPGGLQELERAFRTANPAA